MGMTPPLPLVAAIVVAAGRGERAGDGLPKPYRPVGGVPVLARSLSAFLGHEGVALVLPVIHEDHRGLYEALGLRHEKLLPPVTGGAERQQSCLAGLEALEAQGPELVLIHDAARPFVDAGMIDGVLAALGEAPAALPAVAVTDTLKRAGAGGDVAETLDRNGLFAAQTPQGFRYPDILAAHRRAATAPAPFTDDAAIAEWAGMTVALTPGAAANVKLTRPEDFSRAERAFGESAMETRVGTGYDVHAFGPGDAVVLGGVAIPHERGLSGHSDADAGLHALTDALYGALGEGDIGTHFPPSDQRWRGADSAVFLIHAAEMVRRRGGRIVGLDLTLICERPRIGPHVAAMRARIAGICGIAEARVAVKATTSERLGFTGREEGIAALGTATVELPRTED